MSDEDEIDGTVRDFSRFGEGVVKTQIGQVFVPSVLPGERVALSGVRQQGKVMRTDKVRLLDRSSQRVEPPCPIVQRCGGCPLMIASAPLQAKFKRELLERALRGIPGADTLVVGWVGARTSFAYRRRARLGWDAAGNRLRLGYRRPRSDQIADVPSCAVLDPVLDAALARVRTHVGLHLSGRGQIHLAMGQGERATLALRSDDPQPPELFRALEELVASGDVAGAALRTAGASADAKWGEPREVRKGADGEPLWGTIAGFSQAHDEVNAALVGRVLELARPADRDVLELFSGTGNFTIALAREAKNVLAVEQNPEAADACRDNLRARGLRATVRTDDAEGFRPPSRPDVVVLDPPREGAPGAIKRLVHAEVPEVVYVSCDPPTLGRDVRALSSAGYALTDAIALDMFPQTAHVECVVRLERS